MRSRSPAVPADAAARTWLVPVRPFATLRIAATLAGATLAVAATLAVTAAALACFLTARSPAALLLGGGRVHGIFGILADRFAGERVLRPHGLARRRRLLCCGCHLRRGCHLTEDRLVVS